MEAIGEAKVEWMTSSDIQASDEEVFNYTTVLPIKGTVKTLYNVIHYNRIFNIRHIFAGNRSVSIKIPSL